MLIRAATTDDVPTIVSLIGANARKGGLLPRSEASIRAGLHNFLVAQLEAEDVKNGERDEGMNGQPPNSEPQTPNLKVVGCGSLMPMNTTLVELRSLAVDETLRGFGIGQKLVAALVAEARARKFGTIFALTRAVSFLSDVVLSSRQKKIFRRRCGAIAWRVRCWRTATRLRSP